MIAFPAMLYRWATGLAALRYSFRLVRDVFRAGTLTKSILMETPLKAAQNGTMSFGNTAGRAVLGTMTWRTAVRVFGGTPSQRTAHKCVAGFAGGGLRARGGERRITVLRFSGHFGRNLKGFRFDPPKSGGERRFGGIRRSAAERREARIRGGRAEGRAAAGMQFTVWGLHRRDRPSVVGLGFRVGSQIGV
jgi:hypothetical protein